MKYTFGNLRNYTRYSNIIGSLHCYVGKHSLQAFSKWDYTLSMFPDKAKSLITVSPILSVNTQPLYIIIHHKWGFLFAGTPGLPGAKGEQGNCSIHRRWWLPITVFISYGIIYSNVHITFTNLQFTVFFTLLSIVWYADLVETGPL